MSSAFTATSHTNRRFYRPLFPEKRDQGDPYVLPVPPEAGFFAPGHCSCVRDPELGECLVTHARFGDPASPRQMYVAPLRWTEDDRPYCPPPASHLRPSH